MGETSNPAGIPAYRLDPPPPEKITPLYEVGERNWMKRVLILLVVLFVLLAGYSIVATKFSNNLNSLNLFNEEQYADSQQASSSGIEKDANPAKFIGVKANYLKLGTNLYQLTKATDYKNFANRYELYLVDDNVRVEIEVNDKGFTLPTGFGTEEKRNGNFIQALVPITILVELADDRRIVAIRIPQK